MPATYSPFHAHIPYLYYHHAFLPRSLLSVPYPIPLLWSGAKTESYLLSLPYTPSLAACHTLPYRYLYLPHLPAVPALPWVFLPFVLECLYMYLLHMGPFLEMPYALPCVCGDAFVDVVMLSTLPTDAVLSLCLCSSTILCRFPAFHYYLEESVLLVLLLPCIWVIEYIHTNYTIY